MANAALPPLRPPEYMTLRAEAEPFWEGIIAARARDEWIEAHLVSAVHLAHCEADIEAAQKIQDAEGFTQRNDKGKEVPHAIVGVLHALHQRRLTMMRALQMCGRIMGPTDKLEIRRAVERSAKAAHAEIETEAETLID